MSSKKTVLITGADGFVGKNLRIHLLEIPCFKILSSLRSDDVKTLENKIINSDIIIHLASEIRPTSPIFFENNVKLVDQICSIVKKTDKKIPIIFLSSAHVFKKGEKNSYSKSKYESEQKLQLFSEKTDNPLVIFRPPGIFGKWSRPNYNSVVSTFCFNVVNNIKLDVHDSNKIIDLVYIDDLVSQIISVIKDFPEGVSYPKIGSVNEISLGELAKLIFSFHSGRKKLNVEDVGSGFVRSLYATYLSYLQPQQFNYNIPKHEDERGYFAEILKTKNAGQFSFFTCKSGVTRGQHYHHTKNEKFLVVSGKALFRFRHIISNELYEIETSNLDLQIVDTIPGWVHNITNIGDGELIVMIWANEIFDREKPDTFGCEI